MMSLRLAGLSLSFLLGGAAIAAVLAPAAPAPAEKTVARAVSTLAPTRAPGDKSGWQTVTTSQATTRLRPVLLGNSKFSIPGLSPAATERFWRASGIITRFGAYPKVEMIAYDFGSRCALTATIDLSQSQPVATPNGFVAESHVQRRDGVPSLAVDSVITLAAFLHNRSLKPAPDCVKAIEASYGDGFATTEKSVAKLIDHAASVLVGGPAGSAEAPLSNAAVQQTAVSRIRAGGVMRHASYLGAVLSADHTVIIFGDPHEPIRWAAQYRNLGSGRWQFEGASDAGMTLIKSEKPHA